MHYVKEMIIVFLCFFNLVLPQEIMLTYRPEARLTASPHSVLEVGEYTDLSKAEIDYDNKVQVGIPNKVTVKTKPATTKAVIYMNITNIYNYDPYWLTSMKDFTANYLEEEKAILLDHVGSGVYEGYYTIVSNKIGEISLSLFVMQKGLIGWVYENKERCGPPAKQIVSPNIDYDWGEGFVFDVKKDHVSAKWYGRWHFPESRTYKLYLNIDTYATMHIDGELIFKHLLDDSGDTRTVTIYKEAGEYELVIDYYEYEGGANFRLKWDYPNSGTYTITPEERFKYVVSAIAPQRIKVSCFPGYYLNAGIQQCEECPRGSCQPDYAKFSCIPC